MITAVDSSVLLDILTDDPVFYAESEARLLAALEEGSIVACPPVWAEVSEFFSSPEECIETLVGMRVDFAPLTAKDAADAGQILRVYRSRGGRRRRVSADALIATHAANWGFPLLTRDRGLAKLNVEGLVLV